MSGASEGVARVFDASEDEEAPTSTVVASGIVSTHGSAAPDDDDDEVILLSLEEVELIDPTDPFVSWQRGEPRPPVTRACERWNRRRQALRRAATPVAMLPSTEKLSMGMGALILLTAMMVVFRVAAQ